MNPRPWGDLSAYDLNGMTQTWLVFLCPALPREPDNAIAGENEVCNLDDERGQKTIQLFGFGDYLSHRPIISLSQFSARRVEAEFAQTSFRGLKPDKLPIQSYAFTLPERFYITQPG